MPIKGKRKAGGIEGRGKREKNWKSAESGNSYLDSIDFDHNFSFLPLFILQKKKSLPHFD